MQGISRRELARRMDVSETTVRRHVDAGTLASALLRDGSLDPRKATEALAKALSSAKVVPRELVDARTRRLRAQTQKQTDEVEELQLSVVTPAIAADLAREQATIIAGHLRRVPDAAARLTGLPAPQVRLRLKRLLSEALEAIHEYDGGEDEGEEWWNEVAARPIDLDRLPANALLARRIDLAAQKIEVEHALARGELVRTDTMIAEFEARLAVAKSLLTAIPGRVADQFETLSAEAVRALVAAELDGALAEL